jgi:3-phenylpropionate/trans-cinnamate dioxygenase ferredoxin reductase component
MPTLWASWLTVTWQGEREPYHHLPFFYSDLFEFSYEAVGELDSRLEIVTDLTEQNHLGSDTLPPTESARSRRALGTSGGGKCSLGWELIAEPRPV